MGTDIHEVFQAKKDGKWVDIESYFEGNRHYFLFAWLANVRNGFGFAGVPTHTPITPISEPRGLPEDFDVYDGEYHGSEDCWLGDHSHSWLLADEILNAKNPCDSVWKTGIVELEIFKQWDGVSQPERWCGGISGKDIVIAENPAMVNEDSTHVRISWKSPSNGLDYFINEIKRLKELHGEVRMVFGFDS